MMDDDDSDVDWGLGPGMPPPHVLGLVRAPELQRMSNLLLGEADLLVQRQDHNSYRLAVILAHAACDVQTEDTMAQLCVAKDVRYLYGPIKGAIGLQVSLHVRHVLAFYTALSGDDPSKPPLPWWQSWNESRKRRNNVAHGGHLVDGGDATRTVEACKDYVRHLQDVTARHVPPSWVTGGQSVS